MKKHRIFKKILSLTLCALMLLSTNMSAMAGDIEPVLPTGSGTVAVIGTTPFESLAAALEAAGDGDTVQLKKSVEGPGIVINKSIIVDFCGFTYSFISPGTDDSTGFYIHADNSVVLKNGTVKVADSAKSSYAVLIRNYANLSVQDMHLDGTNLDYDSGTVGYSSVLSCISGETSVIGATDITANDRGANALALDIYAERNRSLPTVKVSTAGTVSGGIGIGQSINSNLSVTDGSFTADISEFLPPYYAQDESGTVITTYQARIGTKYYPHFTDAIADANLAADGAAISLLRDIELDQKISITGNVSIEGAKAITRKADYTGSMFHIADGASLSLDGGVIVDGGNNWSFDEAGFNEAVSTPDEFTNFAFAVSAEGAPLADADMFALNGAMVVNEATVRNFMGNPGCNVFAVGGTGSLSLNSKAKVIHNAAAHESAIIALSPGSALNISEGAEISDNYAGRNGSVSRSSDATVTMTGGSITNNRVVNTGGTVFMLYGTEALFSMSGGKICCNIGLSGPNDSRGAAVYLHSGSHFNMSGGSICHNSGGIDAPYTAMYSNASVNISGGYVGENIPANGSSTADVSGGNGVSISGGTFTQDIGKFLAPNSGLKQNADGSYTTTDQVAEVNGCKYSSLKAAVTAVAPGDTVKLLTTNRLDTTVTIDKDITVDLNGARVYAGKGVDPAFTILGDVTFKNGTVDARSGHAYAFVLGNTDGTAGKLSIESGAYFAETTVVSVTNGTLNILGGEFSANPYFAYEGAKPNYDYLLNCIDANYKAGTAKIAVKGGRFSNFNPQSNTAEGSGTDFTGKGYSAAEISSDVWSVSIDMDMAEACTNGTPYVSLADAVAAANRLDGAKVTLLKNIALSSALEITVPMTLDGAGYKIGFSAPGNDSNVISIKAPAGSDIFIRDLGIEAVQGSQKARRGIAVYSPTELCLENVSITGISHSPVVLAQDSSGSTLTVSNSILSGWCALNLWGSGSLVTVTDSALIGTNDKRNIPENRYGTVVLNEGALSVTVNGGSITAASPGGAIQLPVVMQNAGDKSPDFKLSISPETAISPTADTIPDAVAKVGNTYYYLADSAVDEAEGSPVTLLKSSSGDISIAEDVSIDMNGNMLSGRISISSGATLCVDGDGFAGIINGISVSEGSICIDERTVILSRGGSIKPVADGGILVVPAAGSAIGLDDKLITLNRPGSITVSKHGAVELPADSSVTLSNGFTVPVATGGSMSADGSITQTPDEIENYGYGAVRVIDRAGNSTAFFIPAGESITVSPDKNGSIAVSGSGEAAPLTDGSDSDELPDLSLTNRSGKTTRSHYRSGSANTLVFKCNGFFDGLRTVVVSSTDHQYSKELSRDIHFTLKSGSTVVELKNSYLEGLAKGRYTLTLSYSDGQEVSAAFVVGLIPITGDEGIVIFIIAAGVLTAMLALFLIRRRKARRA